LGITLAKLETLPDDERENTRVQFDMPPKAMERLRVLKDKTEAASYAEVFRNALRFYEFLINEAEKGNGVVVESSDGLVKRTVLVQPLPS
jgi:hypothetical protein